MSTKNDRNILKLDQIIQNISSLLQCNVITLACQVIIQGV